MDWKEYMLKAGTKIIYKNIPEFHSIAVGVWIRNGSRFEEEKVAGISHFIEHLLFKGTKNRTGGQIKEAIEGVGGTFNGFTSAEATCYWIKILSDYTETSIDVLSDMIKNPFFKDEDMEKERNVIIEEIKMYMDIPAKYVYEIFDKILFENHPLGRPIAGTPETVGSISKEQIFKYIENYYTGENIVISIVGNINEGKLTNYIEKYFSDVRIKKKNEFEKWNGKPSGPKVKIVKKETEQSHIVMGGFGFSREDEKKYPLGVLNVILGGNMSSRLFNRIREKLGLAYEIRSFTRHYNDTGIFAISAGVSPENTEKAIDAIISELTEIKEKGVKEEEIERGKKFLISQFLMGLEDNLEYMMWLGEQRLLKDKLSSVNEVVEKINRVQKKDIENVADEIFKKENFYLALIGPKGREENILKIGEKL